FSLLMLSWLFGASHVPAVDEIFAFFFIALSQGLWLAGTLWLLYIALEPYVRRRWPGMLISWSRLLTGSLRDALVGRDLLIGSVLGIVAAMATVFENLVRESVGAIPALFAVLFSWTDLRHFVAGGLVSNVMFGITGALFILLIIFVLRVVTRRESLA